MNFVIYNIEIFWRSESICYWTRLVYTVPAGLPHIRSKMPNISGLCQEFQVHYRTKRTGHTGNYWFTPNWERLFLLVRGHTSVKCIVNQKATCTNQWVISEDRYTCGWKHLNFISTHWNFLRHFQPLVNRHGFSWRAKHTQLIIEEKQIKLNNQCSTFKVPYFHPPFNLILLEL